jgi:hypothetical protein
MQANWADYKVRRKRSTSISGNLQKLTFRQSLLISKLSIFQKYSVKFKIFDRRLVFAQDSVSLPLAAEILLAV